MVTSKKFYQKIWDIADAWHAKTSSDEVCNLHSFSKQLKVVRERPSDSDSESDEDATNINLATPVQKRVRIYNYYIYTYTYIIIIYNINIYNIIYNMNI